MRIFLRLLFEKILSMNIYKHGGFPDVDYMLKNDGKWTWFEYKSPEF